MRSFFTTLSGQDVEVFYDLAEVDESVGLLSAGAELVEIKTLDGREIDCNLDFMESIQAEADRHAAAQYDGYDEEPDVR